MLPPDIAAQLGGGGGAPGGGGPMPPDIGALMAQLGGGGGAPADQGGPTISQGGSHGGGSDAIGQAIDLLNQAAIDEADEQDKQVILTCIANLQKVLANNQKDADAALGGSVSPGAVRKMAPQGGGY